MENKIQMPENQLENFNDNDLKLLRLNDVMNILGFKRPVDFAKAINVSQGYISEILNKKKNISKVLGQKLEDSLNVSRKWFETGEGDMILKETANAKSVGKIDYPIDLRDEENNTFLDLGDGQYVMIVPLVTEYAYMGYLAGFRDPEYIDELPKHTLVVSKHHSGSYRAFEAIGESMENWTSEDMARQSIPSGSIVTGREVPKHHWVNKFHMHKRPDWIIVHKTDGIIIKRMIHHDVKNGIITLRSLNPDRETYPDLVYSLDDVKQVYDVLNVSTGR